MTDAFAPVPRAPLAVLRGPLRDAVNRIVRGVAAPCAQERIWIDPRDVTRVYTRNAVVAPDFKRRHSGMVIDGDWDRQTEPIETSWKIAACLAHFRQGLSWAQTGVIDRMMQEIRSRGTFDSCRSKADVIARYAAIDALHADIRENGFRDETIVRLARSRLSEGVFIHINRAGVPVFGAIGNHRMGIALALGLGLIPAQLGVVHPDALRAGHLDRYREHPA